MTHIDTKLVNSICDRSFRIDCTKIQLIANSVEQPTYEGPGFISFNQKENLQATIYVDKAKASPELPGKAGSMIPHEYKYRLRADSLNGTTWTSKDIPPVPIVRHGNEGEAAIVEIILSEIEHEGPIVPTNLEMQVYPSLLRMIVAEKIEIPCNTASHSEKRVGEHWIYDSSNLNCAKFSSTDIEFLIITAESYTELRAELSCEVANIETRIQETMLFTLSHPFNWSILKVEHGNLSVTKIRPRNEPWSVSSYESPLSFDRVDREEFSVWHVFTTYLDYIRKNQTPNWHAISRHFYFSLSGSDNNLDLKMLRTGVAIEGVLASEFDMVGTDDKAMPAALSSLKGHLNEWSYPDNPECELTIKSRLRGFIGGMNSHKNAKARLNDLLNCGVITKEEIDSWTRCRNSFAHGYYPNQLPNQQDFDDVGRMTTLLHKIIFQAIGYSGKYTDYGQRGWPTLDFRSVVMPESQ